MGDDIRGSQIAKGPVKVIRRSVVIEFVKFLDNIGVCLKYLEINIEYIDYRPMVSLSFKFSIAIPLT